MKRVVVTGMGVISPLGNNVPTVWEACCQGKSGISRITKFDPEGFRTQIAGEVNGFIPPDFLSPKELRKMDLFTQYSIAATEEALKDANLEITDEISEDVGVSLGVGIGGIGTIADNQTTLLQKGPNRVSPFFIPRALANLAPGQVSIAFGTKNFNSSSVAACASSNIAIGDAFRRIERGDAIAMISGGAEAGVTPLSISGFSSMKALSSRNDEPTKASRPYDRDRDGFVFAEGAGILILEEMEFAKARGAQIYAELIGYGCSSDAHHITTPSANGMARAMKQALKDAQVSPDELGYINAHATSTKVGDVTELDGIKLALGETAAMQVSISATKSMSGHLLGGAGALEAVITTNALVHGVIPPTINLENPDTGCDLDLTPNVAKGKKIQIAMSNSSGFGGTNASLVFKAF